MANEKRLFTRQELEALGKNFNELALEALEKGDTERAKFWIEKNEETKYAIHDVYMHWAAHLLTVLYDRMEEQDYLDILKTTVRGWAEPLYHRKEELMSREGLRAYVEFIVNVWRQHCGEFSLEEDDEKITMTHHPCGSGGRLMNENAYEGESGYRRIEHSGPHTWGKKNIPIYCTHCPWAHQILPTQILGKGKQLWVHDYDKPFPQNPRDPCIHYIYKNPEDIPEKYYQYLGMEK
jgi:hypothetical protein